MNHLETSISYEVSVVISARRRNEASYIHNKVASTQVKMENGALEKGELKSLSILTHNSVIWVFAEQNGLLWM